MPEQLEDETTLACHPTTSVATSLPEENYVFAHQLLTDTHRLSPGDRLKVQVIGDDEMLSGNYVIDDTGQLVIAGMGRVNLQGMTIDEAAQRVREQLIARGLVRDLPRVVDINLIESAGVSVVVSGAVFNPGPVRAGERGPEARAGLTNNVNSGDANVGRSLSTAIRAAGGIRPDASVSDVVLQRGDAWTQVDLSGLLDGTRFTDMRVTHGDRITIPSTGCFDARLVRPGSLTIPGIRVYMSNLSRPAASNATAAIGKDTTSLPYGTRLLQGLVSANCVGGSAMNSHRKAILISKNPINQQSVVINRDIEDMLTSAQRDRINPYLMPDDAIACYDSRMMNFRDAFSLLGEMVGPAATAILINDVAQ
ncbi:polysaccharide biosynthesis/export family protein [Halomonas sp. HMF6819]|uniref:polysaccharide biosynthesis/export family protein n=1 Tax=Halomonas sp. HMF6819 TaxID=3373085 RepID=UPI003797A11E